MHEADYRLSQTTAAHLNTIIIILLKVFFFLAIVPSSTRLYVSVRVNMLTSDGWVCTEDTSKKKRLWDNVLVWLLLRFASNSPARQSHWFSPITLATQGIVLKKRPDNFRCALKDVRPLTKNLSCCQAVTLRGCLEHRYTFEYVLFNLLFTKKSTCWNRVIFGGCIAGIRRYGQRTIVTCAGNFYR